MITIKVGGKPLYIPKDTTLVLEQNNNSFDIDNITSDIIWTFDVPGKPNAKILESANYINISSFKEYPCEILAEGFIIGRGKLYIQTVTDEDKISCGVVLDGLTPEFGKRKLKENDYGPDVQISPSHATLDEHRNNWYNFLTGSLNENSVYKFFLFCCEKFYKNNNAFGYHKDRWSPIVGHDEDKTFAKYVNRLFYGFAPPFYPIWQVMNTPDTGDNGLKLFNTLGNNTEKLNGYCFAPAIRLDWLVKKVFANAGFSVTGNFLGNNFIKNLYIQSMNAMDGDMTQFGRDEYLYLTGGAIGTDVSNPPQKALEFGVNEMTYNAFTHGNSASTFNFGIRADVESLQHNHLTSSIYEYEDEAFFFWVCPSDTQQSGFPYVRCCVNSSAAVKDFRYGPWPLFGNLLQAASAAGYSSWGDGGAAAWIKMRFEDNGIFYGIDSYDNVVNGADYLYRLEYNETLIQLTPSHDNSGANYPDPEQVYDIEGNFLATRFFERGNSTNPFCIRLVKAKVKSTKHTEWTGSWNATPNATMAVSGYGEVPVFIPRQAQLEFLEYEETIAKTELNNTNTTMNVFDTMLRWKQHVPNVSNADFIKKLCRFFGLTFYVDPFKKLVQLSFLNDVFNADSIDITEYITNSERQAYKPRQYNVTAATVLGTSSPAEDFLLPDVDKRAELESARTKKRMSVFIRNENAYNIASQDEKSKKYTWNTNAGNNHSLIVGDGDNEQEEITADILVPNMKVVDLYNTPKYICDIETSGNSKLFDDDYTGDFDMIIQQYKGLQDIRVNLMGSYQIETANPTCYDQDGNVSNQYLTLAATGRNSVGEKFLRRFYEFQASRENFRFTAQLPMSIFWKVYQMQLPQTGGATETRWIMVKNRKYIPTKISYEFGEGDKVLATIECARRHYDTN